MLTYDYVLSKSLVRISQLHPTVSKATLLLIKRCYERGVYIVVTQGLRTIVEQNDLYAQGRTKPGPIVTNARGGYSFHNFGTAIDFALLLNDKGQVSWDMKMDLDKDGKADWMEVVEEAKKLGFKWGGDWTSFKDYPHFEMTFGLTCAQYRNGVKPPTSELVKVETLLKKAEQELVKDEDQPMTKDEKLAFEKLQETFKSLTKQVESLENSKDTLKKGSQEQGSYIKKIDERVEKLENLNSLPSIPSYAKAAIEHFENSYDKDGNQVLNTPNGRSKVFYDIATFVYRYLNK